MATKTDLPVCPSCYGYIPDSSKPGAHPGALSRNGLGEICTSCGTNEAFADIPNVVSHRAERV